MAPLNHFSPAMVGQGLAPGGNENAGLKSSMEGRLALGKPPGPEMPDLDQLANYNKLAPLAHIPKGKKF